MGQAPEGRWKKLVRRLVAYWEAPDTPLPHIDLFNDCVVALEDWGDDLDPATLRWVAEQYEQLSRGYADGVPWSGWTHRERECGKRTATHWRTVADRIEEESNG